MVALNMLILMALACVATVNGFVRSSIDTAPVLTDTHQVQFFILESSFPFNAPDNIKETAGEVFQKYYVTHAGLGIWDINSGQKFSIQFVSENYVGALLPQYNESTSQFEWENKGNIVLTMPTDEDSWLSSQLVCVSSGTAYNQLITYLQKNTAPYDTYQPVEIVYYNTSVLQTAVGDMVGYGDVQVARTDSFWFVNQLINELSTYGATIEAYLTVYATAFQYLARSEAAPAVVEWSPSGAAHTDVKQWYSTLSICYNASYEDAKGMILGGITLMENLKTCYGDYAYVYRDKYSVYNVTLMGNHSAVHTPKLTKYEFDLLDTGTGAKEHLQDIDFVLMAVVFVGIIVGVYCMLRRMCRPPVRRRVSMDGEMVAVRTVNKVDQLHISSKNGSGGDGTTSDENDVVQSYYRTKSVEEPGAVRTIINTTVNTAYSVGASTVTTVGNIGTSTVNTVTSIGASTVSTMNSVLGNSDSSNKQDDAEMARRPSTTGFASYLPFGSAASSSKSTTDLLRRTPSPTSPAVQGGAVSGSAADVAEENL